MADAIVHVLFVDFIERQMSALKIGINTSSLGHLCVLYWQMHICFDSVYLHNIQSLSHVTESQMNKSFHAVLGHIDSFKIILLFYPIIIVRQRY